MATAKSWIEAMRLRTLPASIAGVIAGGGVAGAYGTFKAAPFFICLAFAIMAQIVSNFANEYFDFRNGLDKKGRDGFRRGVTEGDITPRAMKRATFGLLAIACLTGLSLIYWGGAWMIAVGIAVAIFALAYSAGPYPLSHHGLGDLAVVIFFGIVPVYFTAYLQAGSPEIWRMALPIGLAVGMMAADILIVNNYRDADDDRSVGKHTTVVIFGRKTMAAVYLLNGLIATCIIVASTTAIVPKFCQLGALVYANVHVRLWTELRNRSGASLNPLLGKTAIAMLVFTLWISALLFLSRS